MVSPTSCLFCTSIANREIRGLSALSSAVAFWNPLLLAGESSFCMYVTCKEVFVNAKEFDQTTSMILSSCCFFGRHKVQ